jgi:hypothetical protein
MKARGHLVVLACALAAALAFPTGASANPGPPVLTTGAKQRLVTRSGQILQAQLGTNNGYSVMLLAFRGKVMVEVKRGETAATYSVRGRFDGERLSANLGRFGTLQGRFIVKKTREEDFFLPNCKGRKSIESEGSLIGTFRFRGEDSYANLSAGKVKATSTKVFRQVCGESNRSLRAGGGLLRGKVLEAQTRSGRRTISFTAAVLDEENIPFGMVATVKERVGRITIERKTRPSGFRSSIEFSPWKSFPRTVNVSPSDPIQGTGTYTEQPDGSHEWTGDLRAPFVGLETVSLTGSRFHVRICRGSLLIIEGCGKPA